MLHVLSHQGGLPVGPKWLTWDKWCDLDTVARAMVERARAGCPAPTSATTR